MEAYAPGGSGSGNSKVRKVRKWLQRVPERGVRLVLLATVDDGTAATPLSEWVKAEVTEEIADEVLEALAEHAVEMGGNEVTAQLAWLDEDGGVVHSLPLKERGRSVISQAAEGGISLPNLHAALAGDKNALVALLVVNSVQQAHQATKTLITSSASLLAHSERMMSRQAEMLETLAERLVAVEQRVSEKDEELEAMADIEREARRKQQSPSGAQSRAEAILMQLAPVVIAKLLGAPQAPPSLPPTQTPESPPPPPE